MVRKLRSKDVVELNEAYQKVLVWFFSFPDRQIGLSDLSLALGISKTTAHRVVDQLVGEGFLAVEVIGRVWRISCNMDHVYNFSRKVAYNFMMVYESCILPEVHKVARNPRAVVLFGSYRKGDDNEKSDIDIAVEVLGNDELRIVDVGVIPMFGYRRNVAVNLYVFSRNKVDLNMFSNIVNGIVLEGFMEVRL